MFKTWAGRVIASVFLAILFIVFGIPAIPGLLSGRVDVYLSGVMFLGLAMILVAGAIFIYTILVRWIKNAPGTEKPDNGDLTEVRAQFESGKDTKPLPSATMINILEMWPGSSEVYILDHKGQSKPVTEVSYDRDYQRVYIRSGWDA